MDAVDRSEAMREPREDFLRRHGLDDRPAIALLAGSRNGEIRSMMPAFMSMASRLHALPEYAGWQILVAAAPGRTREDYDLVGNDAFVHVVTGDTYGVLRHARAAVINSGTASLEAALIGTPQVVGYRTSAVTALIARIILKIKYVSLANLILDRFAFRELLQEEFTVGNLVAEVRRLVEDDACRSRMLADYAEVREKLGGTGASEAVAAAMIGELRK